MKALGWCTWECFNCGRRGIGTILDMPAECLALTCTKQGMDGEGI